MSQVVTMLVLASVLAADAGRVSGVVSDAKGDPVAEAQVLLLKNHPDDAEHLVTRSNADGRFRFDERIAAPDDRFPWVVLAYKPGVGIGMAELPSPANSLGRRGTPAEVFIELAPAAETTLKVVGPDGRPVTEGRLGVSLLRLGENYITAGQVLWKHFAVELSNGGSASLDVLPKQGAVGIEFRSEAFGSQRTQLDAGARDWTMQLRDVGKVAGRVVAVDPEAVKGLELEIRSQPDARLPGAAGSDPDGAKATWARATAITDESGRFAVETIAAGAITASIKPTSESPFRLPGPVTARLAPGESVELTVELKRGVRVWGLVLDAATSDPIPGAEIFAGASTVVTNDEGRFETFALPGRLYVNFTKAPGLHLPPYSRFLSEEIPPGAQEHQLPTIRLQRGRALAGMVVDENGAAVAGAVIDCTWQKTDVQTFTLGSATAVSHDDGGFELKPVPADVELGLTATTRQRAANLVKIQPDTETPIRITAVPAAVAVFSGRVVDTEGAPAAGARVRFVKATRIPSGRVYGQAAVEFNGRRELIADEDGVFRTPFPLPRHEQYTITVEADGMSSHQSDYLTPAAEGPVRFETVVLRRETSVAGIVVDEDGNPVAGATVWSHGQTNPRAPAERAAVQTGADGRFRLEKLHPDARLAFVEKEGYRLRGVMIRKSGAEVRVALPSRDATPAPLHSIRRSADDRRRLLHALIDPILPRLRESESDYFSTEALKRLAPHDPEFVLDQLETVRSDSSRAGVLFALGEIEDGAALAASGENPYQQCFQYFAAVDAAKDPGLKKRLLSEALIHARRVQRPDRRAVALGNVAERLYDLGERLAASNVAKEGHIIAAQLAPTEWSGFARGHFAETLALFDIDSAMQLVEELKDSSARTRHAGNIAQELADIDPAGAEQILNGISRDNNITPYAVRVCYRMAVVDFERARRIADGIGGGIHNRAHAYGVMAMALAESDPAAARRRLQEAFEQLEAAPRSNSAFERFYPVAVTLVRFAETVDPDRTEDYFWRAAALHPGPAVDVWSPDRKLSRQQENTAKLVILLGIYDRLPELRQELMAPIFDHWGKYTNRREFDFYRQNAVFTAMALTDPERTIAWHNSFHAKVSKEDRRLIPQPWTTIADVFAGDDALGKNVTGEVFHLWTIDKED